MDQILSLVTISLALASSVRCSDVYTRKDFPEGFAFGAGASAYQWEGAVDEDGRKPSVWDTFVHSRGDRDNGDIACDGYHKYKEDVQLMVETGLDAYRFSISWSRLIPNGRGPVNPKGLQFYKNFIQQLVSHGIEPHVTLYHYDHPQSLEDEYGGWLNRRIIKDFTAYADVCFREFGDHVKHWTTIDEANIFTIGGYSDGMTPPGHCSSPRSKCSLGNASTETYIVGHNLLLAHASASRLYRQKYKDIQGGSVGFSIFTVGFTPSTSSENDAIAVQRAKAFFFGWMLGPLTFGDYPEEMKRAVGSRLPIFSEEESELVKGSSDFIGVIHYLAASVTHFESKRNPDFYTDMGATMTCMNQTQIFKSNNNKIFSLFTWIFCFAAKSSLIRFTAREDSHWELYNFRRKRLKFRYKTPNIPYIQFEKRSSVPKSVFLSFVCLFCLDKYAIVPWAMEAVLEYIKQSYGNPPVYVLENGTPMKQDLQDTGRIEFLHAYICAVLRSIRKGSDTRGYFVWSFMDLYELLSGYEFTFGLYYVNFSDPHRKRAPKLSAHWYSAFLKDNTTYLGSHGIAQLQSNFSFSY